MLTRVNRSVVCMSTVGFWRLLLTRLSLFFGVRADGAKAAEEDRGAQEGDGGGDEAPKVRVEEQQPPHGRPRGRPGDSPASLTTEHGSSARFPGVLNASLPSLAQEDS
eukprot:6752553-Pyramimonas_sp.AAC.1